MDPVSVPQVDVMNDPAYNTSPPPNTTQEINAEPDHCRICRSEGDPNELLFHPCKCSGSIKFVHQECLMEWLQHSQKKHCELCKTPFQFTKLYDHAMPSSIPTPLFLRRLFRHLVRNIVLWARGALVVFVWLGWLPWCVRWMWRGWFWIGDGDWRGLSSETVGRGSPSVSAPLPSKSDATGNATSLAIGRGIIGFLMSPTLMGGKMSPVNGATNTTTSTNATSLLDNYPNGLFFDSNPFSNLTRYQSVNNIIIDTLEGQLLTALIVVSFILIFLIREWVVQQQPALAGGAVVPQMDLEGEENQQPVAEADDLPLEPVPAGQDVADADQLDRAYGPHRGDERVGEVDEAAQIVRPRAPIRRRRFPPNEPVAVGPEEITAGNDFLRNRNPSSHTEGYGQGFVLGGRAPEYPQEGSSSEGSSNHPTRPQVNREMMARAAEVRRAMEERSQSTFDMGLGTSSAYYFGQSTERTFQFDVSSNNIYTPENGSSSGSRTPARGRADDFPKNAPSLGDMGYSRNKEDMDLVDMGNVNWKWRRRTSSAAASAGSSIERRSSGGKLPIFDRSSDSESGGVAVSPITGTSEVPFPTHANDGAVDVREIRRPVDEEDYDWRAKLAAESNLSENARGKLPEKAISDCRKDEVDVIDGRGKGKDIDILEDMEELGFDSGDDDPQSHDSYSTGYLGGDDMEMSEDTEIKNPLPHTERFTVSTTEVETSDSSTQPSTPTSSDSQTVPLEQPRGPYMNNQGPDFPPVPADQLPEAAQEAMRQIGERRELNDLLRQIEARREQNAQGLAAAVAAQPAARGRGVGLWNWLLGDQGAAPAAPPPPPPPPPPNPINDWDDVDTDDEGDIDDVPMPGDDGAIPPEVQQAIADEDPADDFDGIMELIGMRGPIAGLVQNAAISSVLITATVALGVAFPYVTGKVVMMVLAHPISFFFIFPVTMISFSAEFVVDSAICLLFSFLLLLDQFARSITKPLSYVIPAMSGLSKGTSITELFRDWAMDGQNRVFHKFTTLKLAYSNIRKIPSSGFPPASLVTRQSWSKLSMSLAWCMEKMGLGSSNQTDTLSHLQQFQVRGAKVSSPIAFITSRLEKVVGLVSGIQRSANVTENSPPTIPMTTANFAKTYTIYEWSVWDRVAAVFLGYAFFTLLGAIYLRNARKRNGQNRGVEKVAIELLAQAGGVMKVVLIIGIEMFVFPLYCGLLLDVALLPLFEDATILSRIQFFMDFPLTSIFVHWFVGTCYMFHFALFVSMCRKIMRSGVLYFIRDPDDPTFHPVKDVLDRPVMMQLRKIGFSALIYGVLVLVCLGGVVWSLWGVAENVLPIHWSSNEPVLEFPVDLLFYNFFMPIAVKFFRPSDGLQRMYDWWFKRCARALRLTSFMFGDRRPDEEGHQVRRTWSAILLRKSGDVEQPVIGEENLKQVQESSVEAYFQRDGRFVRAPASDSVRRPKGSTVFIPVSEDNVRLDGKLDPADGPTGPDSHDFQLAYIPPWFRTRIGLMVLGIWAFAAITGIAVTIGPLTLGRFILKRLVPNEVRLNDIYAFSVGIYILGGILYTCTKWKLAKRWVRRGFRTARDNGHLRKATKAWVVRAVKISYVFTAFAIVLPTLFALMIEFYVIIPIHTYFSKDEQHVIHFIQDWTLGVLYVKMMGRMLLLDTESPWARALRGVVARGYLDPDVKLATKCFIAPAGGFMLVALLLPLGLGFVAVNTFLQNAPPTTISQAYRYSYPVVFAIFLMLAGVYAMKLLVDSWKQSIRDEVYLTGERLHNHGDTESSPVAVTSVIPPVVPAMPIADPAVDVPVAGNAGFDVRDEVPPLVDTLL